eukprot:scaffold248708_cov14-Tisochrysis_lutea.AAC.1
MSPWMVQVVLRSPERVQLKQLPTIHGQRLSWASALSTDKVDERRYRKKHVKETTWSQRQDLEYNNRQNFGIVWKVRKKSMTQCVACSNDERT